MKNLTLLFTLLILFFASSTSLPHCDGEDGPVVMAAKKSLETGDISYTLIWVKKDYENIIREEFAKVLNVRTLSPDAKVLADKHFFETVVRIHREGEGEPFTGIKPAGRDLGPVIPAADKSIASGSAEELKHIISEKLFQEIDKKYQALMEKKNFDAADTEAGREYVEAYVQYLHFAENIYKSADFTPHNGNHPGAEGDEAVNEELHKH